MHPPTSCDTLILGAGLAGASAAWHLRQTGQRVLVLDSQEPGSGASGVGAGLANPMMAAKGRPPWRVREALAALEGMPAGGALPFPEENGANILRPAKDQEQAEVFREQAVLHPDLGSWVDPGRARQSHPYLEAPFGMLVVHRGGPHSLTDTVRAWLADCPVQTCPGDWLLTPAEDGTSVTWTAPGHPPIQARRTLLCMGSALVSHPLTRVLHLHAVKGQVIRLAKPGALPGLMAPVSGGAYLIDGGDGSVWVGSTFEHTWDTDEPTPDATASLCERAAELIPALAGADVLEERTGFRVTVPGTRLPMVGPIEPGSPIWVFTGFGAKGLLLTALLGERIPGFFNNPEAIPAECRVVRRRRES